MIGMQEEVHAEFAEGETGQKPLDGRGFEGLRAGLHRRQEEETWAVLALRFEWNERRGEGVGSEQTSVFGRGLGYLCIYLKWGFTFWARIFRICWRSSRHLKEDIAI